MAFRASVALCVVGLVLGFGVGCAGRSAPTTAPSAIAPVDLFPMRTGNAWSYDVDTGEATTTLAITRVEAFDGHVADVRTANAVVRYEVGEEGIRVLSEDAWLVRAPLREGGTWPARGGRTARIVSIEATASTPAGDFDRCVEVLEQGGKLDLDVRTVYCPGVGPVSVTSTMRSNVSERVLRVSARLRGYDVSPWPVSDR